ncbi:dehydrogenase/reductase SDR family member 13-like, partial [Poeciliopsis prolifica]|uniref:dehydrogenase/reductase SDR family member 13-like n=1 Tax=Poeciliopsis prolifica TaxID=188132 RepID=UPI0024140BBE
LVVPRLHFPSSCSDRKELQEQRKAAWENRDSHRQQHRHREDHGHRAGEKRSQSDPGLSQQAERRSCSAGCQEGSILTELQRHQRTIVQLTLKNIERFIFKTALQGSQTTLHCALQESIEHLSGRYVSNCTARNVFATARDDAASKKLWEISERFCGI